MISEMEVLRPEVGVRVEGERGVPRGGHRGLIRERQRIHRQLRRRDQGVERGRRQLQARHPFFKA